MKFLTENNSLLLITIIFSAIALFSCDDTLTVQSVDDKPMPKDHISFAENIYPILQVKCAFSGCHAGSNPADGLDLTTWANVTANPYIVFPGYSDNSILVWTIEGRAGVSPMPPIGYAKPVTLEQIRGIKTWIDEGALNN